ncbi:L,D-transpeptidase [Paracoccus sediminilitoris]|uniref:L,D-transpeptidase n=1 Tax=Paracoccus sediminilitoris TaxID=2202419 RepID=UPI000DB9122D|nr:L,D-transpeptidase [Paracoccus sediminilitoris]
MRLASLLAAAALGLAACGPSQETAAPAVQQPATVPDIYKARTDTGPDGNPIQIAAVRAAYLTDRNRRQLVPYNGTETPGTIVVDPYARVLYHVQDGGQAMRYGVAVGRAGKGFEGSATIARKAAWPSWRPTDNMLRTEPELYSQFAGGLPGGMQNPLGSRALYLYQGSVDTYYRIHGTLDPSSIGKATSAGCIRMFNQDVMDLFEQIPTGTKVIVRSEADSLRMEGPMAETPEGYVQPAAQIQPDMQATAVSGAATAPVATPVTGTVTAADPYASTATVQTAMVTDPFANDAAFVSPVESAVPGQ